jgi:hypothetical protein
MDDAARRVVIAQVINCVFVTAGHAPIEERVTICRVGTASRLPSFVGGDGIHARPSPRAPGTERQRPSDGRQNASSASSTTSSPISRRSRPKAPSSPLADAGCMTRSCATPASCAGRITSASRSSTPGVLASHGPSPASAWRSRSTCAANDCGRRRPGFAPTGSAASIVRSETTAASSDGAPSSQCHCGPISATATRLRNTVPHSRGGPSRARSVTCARRIEMAHHRVQVIAHRLASRCLITRSDCRDDAPVLG